MFCNFQQHNNLTTFPCYLSVKLAKVLGNSCVFTHPADKEPPQSSLGVWLSPDECKSNTHSPLSCLAKNISLFSC